MVEKTRGKCFDCYFYKSNVWDDIFAKHVVWAAKNAIFSLELDEGDAVGLAGPGAERRPLRGREGEGEAAAALVGRRRGVSPSGEEEGRRSGPRPWARRRE
jgi:hypothetical protein